MDPILTEFMGWTPETTELNLWKHSPHTKIMNLIKPGERCLDVGCASGYLMEILTKKGCEAWGIDISSELIETAKSRGLRATQFDLNSKLEVPLPKHYFDVVLFSDVLEHLIRPDVILAKVKDLLKPGGRIIASIPNVARVEIRLRLLFGRFDYQQSGILSKTHLRFFTLSSARTMFKQAGFNVNKIEPTGLGSILKILPSLFSFQFIIVARPMDLP